MTNSEDKALILKYSKMSREDLWKAATEYGAIVYHYADQELETPWIREDYFKFMEEALVKFVKSGMVKDNTTESGTKSQEETNE